MPKVAVDSNVRNVKIESVIHVSSFLGEGIKEDPGRILEEYYTMEGDLLARIDSWKEDKERDTKLADMVKPHPTREQILNEFYAACMDTDSNFSVVDDEYLRRVSVAIHVCTQRLLHMRD